MTAAVHEQALALVRDEIAELERRLAELRSVAQYHSRYLPTPASKAWADNSEQRSSRVRLAKFKQVDAAEAVLKEAGKPLKTSEIVAAMASGGFPVPDAKKLKITIFTSMSRKPDVFEKVGKGIWRIAHSSNGNAG